MESSGYAPPAVRVPLMATTTMATIKGEHEEELCDSQIATVEVDSSGEKLVISVTDLIKQGAGVWPTLT